MIPPDDDDTRLAEQAEIIRLILPFLPGPEDVTCRGVVNETLPLLRSKTPSDVRSTTAAQRDKLPHGDAGSANIRVPTKGKLYTTSKLLDVAQEPDEPSAPVDAFAPAQPIPPERMGALADGRGDWRRAKRRGFVYGALAGAGAMVLVGYFLHVQRTTEITSDLERRNRELGATVASAQARQAARAALDVGVLWRRVSGRRLQGVTPGWPGIGAGWATWDVRIDGQMVMRIDNVATPCHGRVEGDYFVMLCAQDRQVAVGWIAPGPHGDIIVRGDKWTIDGAGLRPVAAFAACPESPTWAKDCTTPMWIEFDQIAARDIAHGICAGVDTDVCRQVGAASWTFPDKTPLDSASGSQKLSELRQNESTVDAGTVDAGFDGGPPSKSCYGGSSCSGHPEYLDPKYECVQVIPGTGPVTYRCKCGWIVSLDAAKNITCPGEADGGH